LAKASEQFRQSDVTLWGLIALCCAGLAVFGSNISLLVPQSIIGGLHQPRVAGASIETLRQQVIQLREETAELRRDNEQLVSRFALQERGGGEIVRRVGALEASLPQILEPMEDPVSVDPQSTASIGENGISTFDAEGGSVSVRRLPMPGLSTAPVVEQPLPERVEQVAEAQPDQPGYGVGIGAAVPAGETDAVWDDLSVKLGPLLLGLSPLVAEEIDGSGERVVIGPFEDMAEARQLCESVERVSIPCMPMPYAGEPLAQPQ
jgi:hypothetical protein